MTRRARGRGGWRQACIAVTLCGGLLCVQGAAAWAGALERAMLGKSTVVDLTHTVPGPEDASDRLRPDVAGGNERPGAAAAVPAWELGTRLDARGLVGKERGSVAGIPSRELLVRAVVVNVAARVAESPDYQVTVDDLRSWERQNGRVPRGSAVLLRTGWSRWWAEPDRYVNRDVQGVPRTPGFSPAAMAFLVAERQIRGVGLDAPGQDVPAGAAGDAGLPRMPPGVWQLENLDNLDKLPTKGATLVVAPLRIDAATAPARVIAILP
jgi:kynurenine formamidase